MSGLFSGKLAEKEPESYYFSQTRKRGDAELLRYPGVL